MLLIQAGIHTSKVPVISSLPTVRLYPSTYKSVIRFSKNGMIITARCPSSPTRPNSARNRPQFMTSWCHTVLLPTDGYLHLKIPYNQILRLIKK